MGGHLPASAVRIVAGPDCAEQVVQGDLPDRQRKRSISVIHVKPIVPAPQVGGHRHLHRFVPSTGDLEEALVLTFQADFPVIQLPGGDHSSVGIEQPPGDRTLRVLGFGNLLLLGCHLFRARLGFAGVDQ